MHYNIVGWYGHKNVGDDAFAAVFRHYLSEHQITFSNTPLSPSESQDFTIFGGGGVMVKNYVRDKFKTPAFAVGVDIPVNGSDWDHLCRLDLEKIWVRSREYTNIAQEQGLSSVEYCPDIVFGLPLERVKPRLMAKPVLGITLTYEILSHLQLLEQFRSALDIFRGYYQIKFFSFYEGSGTPDSKVHARLKNEEDHEYCYNGNVQEFLRELAVCDFNLTMRFHGAIFSTLLGTPFISIANKGKCSLYCEQERLYPAYIELRELTQHRIYDRFEALMDNQHALRLKLRKITESNRAAVTKVFESLKQDL